METQTQSVVESNSSNVWKQLSKSALAVGKCRALLMVVLKYLSLMMDLYGNYIPVIIDKPLVFEYKILFCI